MKQMYCCRFEQIKTASICTRVFLLTILLLLLGLTGCSGDDHHDFHKPGRIPIDPKRWYQLNNTSNGIGQLFNQRQFEHINTGYGTILDNYDAWYPLADGEQMTIDSLMMFDWEGTNEDHPMTIYIVTEDWKRLPIAVFTGMRYSAWNGPDPKKPDVYKLDKPASNIRYIIINSWGDFPGEIEFYGSYKSPTAISRSFTPRYAPLKNYFGVNAFEWDFEEPHEPFRLDPARLAAIKNFTGVRHYMDWDKLELEEGVYSFSPVSSGGWNYDTIYQWCYANNIDLLPCLKACPPWLLNTYPEDLRDNENIPMRYGKDPSDPTSYIEQAKAGFQFAARYGSNKNIDPRLIRLAPDNTLRTGLGTVKYLECDNERDKWWRGRKCYQTAREYAANLSAFYDGNKNKMGPGVGVKNADPNMNVVMAGLSTPDAGYLRGMIDWCKEFRGYRADGSVDVPWDIINYHYYCNDADYTAEKKQSSGIAPELTKAGMIATDFVGVAHQYLNDMPVWVTEAGYDINQESPQKAPAINGKTALQIQADWTLRTSLMYARAGVQKVFYYELIDDNPKMGGQYASSGLVNTDRSPRPVADYFAQVTTLFGNYTFSATVSKLPVVDKYTFNGNAMFMLVMPSQDNKTTNYTLDLGSAQFAFIYLPNEGGANMKIETRATTNGKIQIQVSESPIFVTSSLMK